MLLHGPVEDVEVLGVYYKGWGDVWDRAAVEVALATEGP